MREKFGVSWLMGMLALSAAAFTVDPAKTVIVSDRPQDLAVQSVKGNLDAILGADVKVVPVKEAAKLGAETYMWRLEPASARDRAVERYSWDVSPTGAVFRGGVSAVSGYFEDRMGARYPWGTEVAWHGTRPAEFVADAGDWTPELRIRNMRGKGDGLLWRFRLRDGAHDRPNYGHAFCWYWKRFSKTHPEFFAMRADGKRLPVNCDESVRDRDQKTARPGTKEAKYIDHISMCPSCEGLADQLVEDWKAAGAPKYLNACENDSSGQDVCTCDACKALDEPKPADAQDWWPNWYADRYVVFTKRVLERARKVRPDVKVVMYAYNATERAPRREKLDKDIIVGMVPTYFSTEAYLEYIDEWKAAGMTEFFLRSNRRCYFSAAYTPVGWERHFFDLVRAAIDRGAIGFDFDGGTPKAHCPTAWLCDYVVKKAMTDPTKDFDFWMNHYCESFGAAKDEMNDYFRYWRAEVFEKRIAPDFMKLSVSGKVFNFTRGLFWKLGDYYRPSDYAAALAILDRALAKPGLADADRARVAEVRFQTEHAALIYEAVVHKNLEKAKYARALYDFRKAHDLQIMPHYEDYWGDLTGMRMYNQCLSKGLPTEPTDVYLLIGQSNMAGRGTLDRAHPVDTKRVQKLTKDGFWAEATEPIHFDKPSAGAGLAASFARKMADADEKAVIGLVPCALGGSPLSRWMPGCDLYTNAVARTRRALASGGRLKGIFWHQGETDAKEPELRAIYAERLVKMLTALRAELGAADVPIVLGELKSFRPAHDEPFAEINAALKTAAEKLPRAALVPAGDLNHKGDTLHFDTPSQRTFGLRYAEALLKL